MPGPTTVTGHFEGSILEHLKEHGYLTSDRARRNELAPLESRLNLVLISCEELERVTNDEKAQC